MKAVIFLLVLALHCLAQAKPVTIALFVSEGFQIDEYQIPKRIFEEQGFKVTTVGPHLGAVHSSSTDPKSLPAQATKTYADIQPADFTAIVMAGGGCAWKDYFPNKEVHRILTAAFAKNQLIGLLCAATGVLATANNLDGKGPHLAEGRHITGYEQVEGLLRTMGKVNFDPGTAGKPYSVIDKNLVTGRDPMSAEVFAQNIVSKLKSQ